MTETRVHELPAKLVSVEGRIRRSFDDKKMIDLLESLKKFGQLQPGVCRATPDGNVILVAGERRLRACSSLDIPFKFVILEEMDDPVLRKEAEYEENVCREDLTWQDRLEAYLSLHELKQQLYGESRSGREGGWSQEDTAEAVGKSRSVVQEDLEIAEWARVIPEVRGQRSKSDARKVIKKLKDATTRHHVLKTQLDLQTLAPDGNATSFKVELGEETLELSPDQYAELHRLKDYDRRCRLGKMEDHLGDFDDGFFHIVLFDPPWGQGYTGSEGQFDYADDPKTFQELLRSWLDLLWQKMDPQSHLYMFFGIVDHWFVYQTLKEVGFSSNGMPIIWIKKGSHRTQNPHMWPGRSYEPIAFARKGDKPLYLQGKEDHIITKAPSPKMKGIHPSAKHPGVYEDLLLRSGFPGNRVLDPMAGSGMVGVAADYLKNTLAFDWFMIEEKKVFRDLQIENLAKGYLEIINEKEEVPVPVATSQEEKAFDSGEPSSFEGITPGSEKWMEYWDEHPEEQEAMLEWRKK